MASIVYRTDKASGRVYAYSSESYWDKEKKQPRSKRTYLGRVDPETGEIIKGENKKKTKEETARPLEKEAGEKSEEKVIQELKDVVKEREKEIALLRREKQQLIKKLEKIRTLITACEDVLGEEAGEESLK